MRGGSNPLREVSYPIDRRASPEKKRVTPIFLIIRESDIRHSRGNRSRRHHVGSRCNTIDALVPVRVHSSRSVLRFAPDGAKSR